MKVKDRVVIVTGASSGIGLAAAKLLSQKGAKVVLVARSKEKLEKIVKDLPNCFYMVSDMSKESQIKAMIRKVIKQFGRIDILINNAGIGYDSPVEKIDVKKFRYLFDLDLVGVLVAMKEVVPIMRKIGGGSIVNISSGTALLFLPNMGAYSSIKRALVGISLTAREELKKDKIFVSVVYPFMTETDFEKNTLKEKFEAQWPDDNERGFKLPPPDCADFVAGKILEAIESEKPEIFAHDWMKNRW